MPGSARLSRTWKIPSPSSQLQKLVFIPCKISRNSNRWTSSPVTSFRRNEENRVVTCCNARSWSSLLCERGATFGDEKQVILQNGRQHPQSILAYRVETNRQAFRIRHEPRRP